MKKVKQTQKKEVMKEEAQAEPKALSKKSVKESVDRIGRELKQRLESHFDQWHGGLSFKTVMSGNSYKAKGLGLTVGELAQMLEDEGYIRIIHSPNGARYLFSADCKLNNDELLEWLQTQEMKKG